MLKNFKLTLFKESIKKIINNPYVLLYVAQGYYKDFIRKEYNKYFDKDGIDDLLYKVSQCPECYQNGNCLQCGCPINKMLYSNKSCPNGKF